MTRLGIHTITVDIKTVRVNGHKMTLSVWDQMPESKITENTKILGRVNRHDKKKGVFNCQYYGEHAHLLCTDENGIPFKCLVSKSVMGESWDKIRGLSQLYIAT